jgi:hypothetical protein
MTGRKLKVKAEALARNAQRRQTKRKEQGEQKENVPQGEQKKNVPLAYQGEDTRQATGL